EEDDSDENSLRSKGGTASSRQSSVDSDAGEDTVTYCTRRDEIWQVSGANSTLLGNTSEITTAMDATAMQQMLDALFQKQEVSRKADLQKQEDNRQTDLQKQVDNLQKLEENRQADLQRIEDKMEANRVADQDRFSEALQLMEQRQDAVENLLRNGGDEQNNSLHNASVSRMVQRDERDERDEGGEASSDEENNRQSRQNSSGAKDSLKKTRSWKPSSSQDVRFKPIDEGQTKSGRVFRNSALDHSPEIQPIL
ncbi:MAG: DUF4175 domain-containing protein, partial [Gammaproteobacteria bacterium]|nr:DUF4175 domain-containing protein [Gammaproteobacteria bacterium]